MRANREPKLQYSHNAHNLFIPVHAPQYSIQPLKVIEQCSVALLWAGRELFVIVCQCSLNLQVHSLQCRVPACLSQKP